MSFYSQNPISPWNSSILSAWPGSYVNPFSLFSQMPAWSVWNRPQTVICKIYEDRRPPFESRQLFKREGNYYMRERNGREVFIGKLSIPEQTLVNPREDGTFDCLFFTCVHNGQSDKVQVQIPYRDLIRGQIKPYLYGFPRNPDCPDSYIVAAFFEELKNCENTQFLVLPPHSGWNRDEQHTYFVSAETMIPHLLPYYAPDIPKRRVPRTDTTFADAASRLSECLPEDWRSKILLAFSTSSYMLPFYADAGFRPDKFLVVKPDSEQNAKLAATLLSTQNYSDTCIYSLTGGKKELESGLKSTWDGVFVSRDSSSTENRKPRVVGLDVLVQDLKRGQGLDETPRHMLAIISDNPGLYTSDLPARTIRLSGCEPKINLQELRRRVGEFHGALVRLLESSQPDDNLVTDALKNGPKAQLSIHQQGLTQTDTIIRYTLFVLLKFKLLTEEEYQTALRFLRSDGTEALDSDAEILNDFRTVFSDWILRHPSRVVPQNGPPYIDKTAGAVIVDNEYVNIQSNPMDFIIARMRTTQRRNVVLAALKSCGKLHSTISYKRMVEVETSPGVNTSLFVYSIPRIFLTGSCQEILGAISMTDHLFNDKCLPDAFLPMISVNGKWVAGKQFGELTDEAESLYVCGQTRSGKTFFMVQQTVIRAASEDQLIVFDQTNAFSPQELEKYLPDDIISEYFSYWNVGENGLPVDLLSLDCCTTLQEKKDRLFSVLSVMARITGEVQGKHLRKHLTKIVHAIESGSVRRLPDILRFFDLNDPDQKEIAERMEETFDDLQGLPISQMTWTDFCAENSKIVVISTADDGIRKSSQLIDALMASLYAWKQDHRTGRLTIVLDEIEDLCFEKSGPIGTILRKGGKHRLSMLLASQEYSVEKDRLGKLIGNCGMLVFFRPKDACIDEIAKHTGIDRRQLAAMEQGECFAVGGFYSKQNGKNKHAVIHGMAYSAAAFLAPVEPPSETQDDSDEFLVSQELLPTGETLSETLDLPDLLLTSSALDETEPSALEKQQSPEADNDEAVAVLSETMEPESVLPPAQDPPEGELADVIPETEKQPKPPESDPDEPEENPQELIEAELQQQFQELKRKFNPDYPCWSSYLTEFFTAFLERHHFADAIERDRMEERLHSFLHVSTEQYRYVDLLNDLFSELWPTG